MTSAQTSFSTTIFFYNPDGTWQEFLSPWYECTFVDPEIKGIVFRSSEMYMMLQKAKYFGDEDAAKRIAGEHIQSKLLAIVSCNPLLYIPLLQAVPVYFLPFCK